MKNTKPGDSKTRLSNRIWWARYSLAVAVSPLSAYISFANLAGELSNYAAFALAVIAYVASYLMARYVFKLEPSMFRRPRDLALQGVFAYFVGWFAFWIFFYTIMLWVAGAI